jgi:DNA repair exonuclease SbcCD ATPase subunit
MRPRELTVEGFRSHRHRTTFDFRDRRLIGIVGPIGAGKSSLLDAVVFALYGKTPTFERDTRSLIHQLADIAKVQLEFEVDRQRGRSSARDRANTSWSGSPTTAPRSPIPSRARRPRANGSRPCSDSISPPSAAR